MKKMKTMKREYTTSEGDEWIFEYDYNTGEGTLKGSDIDWESYPCREGSALGLILCSEEKKWLNEVWMEAQGIQTKAPEFASHIEFEQLSKEVKELRQMIQAPIPEKEIEDFDIENGKEGKESINRSVTLRKGQGKFRKELLKAYDGKCAVTSCSTVLVLEAAHIAPYDGGHTNHVQNGLLLRSDIHKLFDLNLLRVGEDYVIYVHEEITEPEYRELHGNVLNIPKKKSLRPSKKYLAARAEPSTREDEEE